VNAPRGRRWFGRRSCVPQIPGPPPARAPWPASPGRWTPDTDIHAFGLTLGHAFNLTLN